MRADGNVAHWEAMMMCGEYLVIVEQKGNLWSRTWFKGQYLRLKFLLTLPEQYMSDGHNMCPNRKLTWPPFAWIVEGLLRPQIQLI